MNIEKVNWTTQRLETSELEKLWWRDSEWGFMPCGQVCGGIDDIPSCQELVEQIMREVDDLLYLDWLSGYDS